MYVCVLHHTCLLFFVYMLASAIAIEGRGICSFESCSMSFIAAADKVNIAVCRNYLYMQLASICF